MEILLFYQPSTKGQCQPVHFLNILQYLGIYMFRFLKLIDIILNRLHFCFHLFDIGMFGIWQLNKHMSSFQQNTE